MSPTSESTSGGEESREGSVVRRGAQKTVQKAPKKAPHLAEESPRKRKAGYDSEMDQDDSEESDSAPDEDDYSSQDSDSEPNSDDDESGGGDDERWSADGDEDEENMKLCIHCDQDEENDPAPEYEDPLECAVCGAFSHRQCDLTANENGAVKSAFNDDDSSWRCPTCMANGHERHSQLPEDASARRRNRREDTPEEEEEDERPRRLRKRKSHDFEDEMISTRLQKRRASRDISQSNGAPLSRSSSKIPEEDEEEEEEGTLRSNRTATTDHDDDDIVKPSARRKRKHEGVWVSHLTAPGKKLVSIRGLPTEPFREIVSKPPQPSRSRDRDRTRTPARARTPARKRATPAPLPQNTLTTSTALYPIRWEEGVPKPYGGILSKEEANTADTMPVQKERDRFDAAKNKVEEEKKMRAQLFPPTSINKRRAEGGISEASLIECIHFGKHEIDTWYAAPYPEEYSLNKVLWICEFCLKYMNSEYVCWRHKLKCPAKHPPGDEIYRDGSISVFEVDGRKQPVYCQNLCLMSKLFLGSKTLYYDVHPFLFYVMTESDDYGMHFVGYFSKEKREGSQSNVSCILTLPIHQRKGYGNLLIDFSYLLTRAERKTGTPEKPFSDLGLVSYRNYWKLQLCYQLRHQKDPITIGEISKKTGMTTDDIICGLEALNALVRDPVTGTYALRLDYNLLEATIEKWEKKGYVKLNPDALLWTPYVMGKSQAEQLSEMPISTIAPRPEEEEDGDETMHDADGAVTAHGTAAHDGADHVNPDGINPAVTPGAVTSPVFSVTSPLANGTTAPASVASANAMTPEPPFRLSSKSPGKRAPFPPPPELHEPPLDIPPSRFEVVTSFGAKRNSYRGTGTPRNRSKREKDRERDRTGGRSVNRGTPGKGKATPVSRGKGDVGKGKGGEVRRGKGDLGRPPAYGKAPRSMAGKAMERIGSVDEADEK